MSEKQTTRHIPLYGEIDERTYNVVYQGDAYTGRFLSFALLIYTFVRGMFFRHLSDEIEIGILFAIVMIGSGISLMFQLKHKLFSSKRSMKFMLILLLSVARDCRPRQLVSSTIASAQIVLGCGVSKIRKFPLDPPVTGGCRLASVSLF